MYVTATGASFSGANRRNASPGGNLTMWWANAAWKKFFVMEDIPQEIQYKAQTVQLQDDITIIEVRYAGQNASS